MPEQTVATDDVVVEDNPEESRYEARLGDRIVGIAEYELADEAGPIVFTHTEVLPEAEGQGVGGRLGPKPPSTTSGGGACGWSSSARSSPRGSEASPRLRRPDRSDRVVLRPTGSGHRRDASGPATRRAAGAASGPRAAE